MTRFAVILSLLMVFGGAAYAVNPDEVLEDPALEERARTLSQQLRCVVCQNQDIDTSDAPLAKDLRLVVRDRLVKGDSDQEVLDFVVERYGTFVLLRPPFNVGTFLLWFGPLILVVMAGAMAALYFRNAGQSKTPQPLSAEEKSRLDELLGEEEK